MHVLWGEVETSGEAIDGTSIVSRNENDAILRADQFVNQLLRSWSFLVEKTIHRHQLSAKGYNKDRQALFQQSNDSWVIRCVGEGWAPAPEGIS